MCLISFNEIKFDFKLVLKQQNISLLGSKFVLIDFQETDISNFLETKIHQMLPLILKYNFTSSICIGRMLSQKTKEDRFNTKILMKCLEKGFNNIEGPKDA